MSLSPLPLLQATPTEARRNTPRSHNQLKETQTESSTIATTVGNGSADAATRTLVVSWGPLGKTGCATARNLVEPPVVKALPEIELRACF
jgi:hypothetical protein